MAMLIAVALLSGAALAFEVLLVRALAITQWHHFASLIISGALLGYGASGTALAFLRAHLAPRWREVFAVAAAVFSVAALGGFALAQTLPLNLLELPWDPTQLLYLLAVYLVLAFPFFAAALAIGLALSAGPAAVGRTYACDLCGAGAGALMAMAGLSLLPLAACMKGVAAAGRVAAALAALAALSSRLPAFCLALLAAALPFVWPAPWAAPRPSPYKDLSLQLTAPGARVLTERSSPLGLITVVESPEIPVRYAPGLSLASPAQPPEQWALFIDGHGLSALTRFDGTLSAVAFVDQVPAALPYHLRTHPRVAIIGAGGGFDVLLARYHEAARIFVIDLNPQVLDLVAREFADFSGHLYERPEVSLHAADGRAFLATLAEPLDLIHIALGESAGAGGAGLAAGGASALLTAEAVSLYLDRLAPAGGLLAVTRWLEVPPRDSLKLALTAIEVLERRGVADPGRHLAMVRGFRTVTLVVATTPLTDAEVAGVRSFAAARGFDLGWLPGMAESEANRFHVLDREDPFHGVRRLLGPERQAFLDSYPFLLAPATDDKPYFSHFLKTATLARVLARPEDGGLTVIDWGYPILLATLAQAALASLVLILLPLLALPRGPGGENGTKSGRLQALVAVSFFSLGLAFLFVEIAFIQGFTLFLGSPVLAVAVAIGGFLVFAGTGSALSPRVVARAGGPVRAVVAAVAVLTLLLAALVGTSALMFAMAGSWPLAARIAVAAAISAPLALAMGVPFPVMLAVLREKTPALAPWAWGINGCASVISALLATLIALHAGFTALTAAAALLYAAAAFAFAGIGRGPARSQSKIRSGSPA